MCCNTKIRFILGIKLYVLRYIVKLKKITYEEYFLKIPVEQLDKGV